MSTNIYVNSTWKSGEKVTIDGVEYTVGVDAFTSYGGAKAYALANDTKATIIIEKTTTVSGNCLDQDNNQNTALGNLTFIVKDGAVIGDAASKLNITYALTIEAGAIFQTARSATSGGVIHLQDTLTIAGDKENGKYAYIKLGKLGSYRGLDFAALYNGKIVATYADITVRDLGCTGPATFTDCKVSVQGALSAGVGYAGKLTLVNSDINVLGHHNLSNTYFKAFNQLKYVTMTNSTITIDDGVEGTVADKVEFNSVTMTDSTIKVEKGTAANVVGTLTITGTSTLDVGALDIGSNKKIVIDNTSTIIANALTGTGTIEINVVDKFSGFDQVIDLASGADTTGLLDRITIKQDGYSAMIKDGDIYIASFIYVGQAPEGTNESDIYTNIKDALAATEGRVVQITGRFVDVDQETMTAIENGNVKFAAGTMLFLAEGVTTTYTDENLTIKAFGVKAELTDGVIDLATDNAILTGNVGSNDANIGLTTGTTTEGSAEVRGDVTGNDVTISNGKNLNITGSVSGSNVDITNADNAVLDGGSDDYSAKITADENITFVNDGHAVVDLTAKNIEVENNSVNTITNSTITADTVVIDAKENADGVVSNSVITAKDSIDIADQTVTGTTMSTAVMNVYGNTVLGEDNQYSVGKFEFGSLSESVDAVIDVTNLKSGSIAIQNGSLTMIGQMDENNLLHPLLPGGMLGNPERGDMNSLSGTINIGDKDHTDAYVRIDQSQIGEDEAVNNHTLNVYGKLYANSSIYNKGKGILNIYGDVEINKYLQAAGVTLVDGKDATLYVNKDSAFSGTSGIRIGGKNGFMSQFTIDNGATVVVGDKVEVGYVSSNVSRNGDLFIKNGGSLTVDNLSVNTGASVTIAGGLLDVETLTILDGASFTIDAANFTSGVYQALDLSMSAEDAAAVLDKITITNVGAGVEVIKKEDGDIIFTKVSADTIYINSNWTDKQYGEDLGEGKYLGFNAFSSIPAASEIDENTTSMVIQGGNYVIDNASVPLPDASTVSPTLTDYLADNVTNISTVGEVVITDGNLVFETESDKEYNISGSFTTLGTDVSNATAPGVENPKWPDDYLWVTNGQVKFKGTENTIFNIDGNITVSSALTFDGAKTTISKDSVIKLSDEAKVWPQVCVYGKVTSYGSMDLTIVEDNGSLLNINKNGELVFSGEKAVLTTSMKEGSSNSDVIIHAGSSLAFEDKASAQIAGKVTNDGTISVAGGNFTANVVSGKGAFNVGTAFDEEGTKIATTLNIGELNQNIVVNKDAEKQAELTGSIDKTTNTITTYNTIVNGFSVNGNHDKLIVQATGHFQAGNGTIFTGDSLLNLNSLVVKDDVEIASDATIKSANVNVYDSANNPDAIFSVKGTLEACTLIIVNTYYYTYYYEGEESSKKDITSDMIVEQNGIVKGYTQSGNGLFGIQFGNMTVQGYVEGNWNSGGGASYIGLGQEYWPASLTVDGTYASEDSNNGKFINTGDATLTNRVGADLNVNNNGLFSWDIVKNEGRINVNNSTFIAKNMNNTGSITLTGGNLSFTNTIQNAGTLTVNGGTLTLANAIQNNGTITFANTVNGNITIEGTGSTTLNDKAVIADSLKANIAIAGVAALDEDATFTGEIDGGALKIDGNANTLQITNNNNATLVIGNNAVIGSDDQISDIAIKGETKQSVLTIDVANLSGNNISDLVLNITGIAAVTEEIEINADFNLAILNSVTVDGIEYQVKSFAGNYYCNATDSNLYLTKVDGGIDISSAASNAGETTTLLEDQKSFNITDSADLGDAAIEMKKGTTTVTIKKDIDFTIGDIQKSDEGGLNNVSIGNNAKLTVNGTIDSFNNLTVGKESTVVVKEELIGTAGNQTIKLGNNSTGKFADIDLAGGNNTITLGKEAELEADSINNVTKLTLGNDATATVKDINGTAKNNTISVGKAASLTLENDINLAEGKDTLKIDKSANLTASNLSGIETITFGSGSNVEISGTVSGVNKLTIANNLKNSTSTIELNDVEFTDAKAKLTIGKLNNVTAGDITFGNNNDTLKIDNDSYVVAKDVIFGEGKDTLELGKNATFEVTDISGISTLKAKDNSLLIVKNGTDDVIFADTMKGNWSKLTIYDYQGDITEGTITGNVYSNEYDTFNFDLADGQFFIIGNWSDSTDIFISKFDETTQTWSEWSADVTNHEVGSILLDQAGKYAFSVAVSDSMFGKDALEKESYSFDVKLLA